jgi:hypothetical protein
MPHKETNMTTISRAKLGLTAAATAAVAIALPATANAGLPPSFQTPSGNIMCWVDDNAAVCRIVDYTYSAQQQDCPSPGGPNEFWLKEGAPAVLKCSDDPPGTYAGLRTSVTLDYGQTKSVGVMTCASEPSGVTCIDTSTGHFVRVSRDSYELG